MTCRVLVLTVLAAALAAPAAAQPLGTFRWQIQPHCNIVSVTVVQQGAQYLLDGTDDQCGATERAAVRGLAFLNPDGSIGFGFSIVGAPYGAPVHVSATLSLATLSGSWRDSTGDFGYFVFTPGAGTGGPPRPDALAGDITSVTAGAGLTGGDMSGDALISVNYAATQQRVTGTCPSGQLMTGVNQNGSVVCQSVTGAGGGDITAVAAGTGLTGGGATGDVALAVSFSGTGAASSVARSDHTHAAAGSNNTAAGAGALLANTSIQNTAFGANALAGNVGGGSNTAVGALALSSNQSGNNNTALGSLALDASATGGNNTGVGASALGSNLSGGSNTAVGVLALFSNTSGGSNTAVGQAALSANTTGFRNVAVGMNALAAATASGNTAVGYLALGANTTGASNAALGESALRATTTGNGNTAVGHYAMELNTTGSSNTAVGAGALSFNETGTDNTAVGRGALVTNETASFNTAIGRNALGSNTLGANNTAAGRNALFSNTSGSGNVAVGVGTLQLASAPGSSTAVGVSALSEVTTGTDNIGIGFNAGLGLTTGSSNIYVGGLAGSASESSTIRIGSGQNATYLAGISGATASGGIPVLINGAGRLGTTTSSARFKEQITPLGDSLRAKIQALGPVSFVYRPEFDDGSRQIQYGLIAEEVADTFPELLVLDADGRPQTVRYHLLTPLLLAEVQRLERERDALESRVRALEEALTTLVYRDRQR